MERKKKGVEEPLVIEEALPNWYHNKGKSFRIGRNRIIKPGQTFQAFDHEIPQAFRDIIVPVKPKSAEERAKEVTAPQPPVSGNKKKPIPPSKSVTPVTLVKSEYKAVQDEATGDWNIMDPQGVAINEVPIKDEQEALSLAQSLSN